MQSANKIYTKLWYNLRAAHDAGETRHPGKVVEGLGYIVTNYEGIEIADAVCIEISGVLNGELPEFIKVTDYEFIAPKYEYSQKSNYN